MLEKPTIMLRKFEDADFRWLQRWVTSPELLLQFSGDRFSFPLGATDFADYRLEHPDRTMYVAARAEQLVAFGEIIPQDSGRPRLGRILIGDPAIRGKGVGMQFITALLGECQRLYKPEAVELNVWDENKQAIRCYEKAGFVFQPNDHVVLHASGRSFNIHKMVRKLPTMDNQQSIAKS